ncbi:MAG: 2'-5' RNA ligase family protein, partial [Nanoarchaeota archaeon]
INVVWMGVENSTLVSLMKEVGKELGFVRKNDHDEDVAHLTIARVKTERNKKELQEFAKRFEGKEFGRMKVEKIILFESELRKEGAEHRVVKEFRLK